MAATLVNVALSSIRKAHATYYGDVDDNNPVIVAVKKELSEYCEFMLKTTNKNFRTQNQGLSRSSNWIFDIWNKYEPRLPEVFFKGKLIEIGDYLLSLQNYDIAFRQCYNRLLVTFYNTSVDKTFSNVEEFRLHFFNQDKNKLDTESSHLMYKAISGSFSSLFYMTRSLDTDFTCSDSLQKCLVILQNLQFFMQCLQPYERLCWMLYNCTIIMYQICRGLMASGYSSKVLKYLIWSAICMESSVPLLAVKYLTWRVTLYTTVCHAYYDCKAGEYAENFARRSLNKLQELSDLEYLSKSPKTEEIRIIFQQATVKMAAMVFKRTVFETRKRPKGVLRPKQKNNLKEAAQHIWPRTTTEKLLVDMFEGTGAQFLAILEALNSTQNRMLSSTSLMNEVESEVADVYAELFFAGKEIIAGGGRGKGHMASGADHSVLAGIRHNKSLVQIAALGEDGVTLVSVIRFIKLAFRYEQWDTFSSLLDSALLHIKKTSTDEVPGSAVNSNGQEHSAPELCLALLLVMERVLKVTKVSKKCYVGDNNADGAPPLTQGSVHSTLTNDDLLNLAETVLYCISDTSLFFPQGEDGEVLLDPDVVVDACLLLWKKCKSVFAKSPMLENLEKSLAKKWLRILQIIHNCFTWCQFSNVDSITTAEVSLHLSLCYENDALHSDELENVSKISVRSGSYSYSPKSGKLNLALQVLQEALTSIANSQTLKMKEDKDVCDTAWMKDVKTEIDPTEAMVRDLYIELLNVHHRIAVQLLDINESSDSPVRVGINRNASSMSNNSKPNYSPALKSVNNFVGESLVSGALMKMQKAVLRYQKNNAAKNVNTLLEQAAEMLLKAQDEEKQLHLNTENIQYDKSGSSLPPPKLIARSQTSMIFKPAQFNSQQPIAWYRIFGRLAAGSNVKVRLNDYFLEGTGEEVPADGNTKFIVKGLKPFRRYVFAVAAYSKDGRLIDNRIGETGEVILAQSPTSLLLAWSLLAEISHKIGVSKIASFASQVLWEHFVDLAMDELGDTWTTSSDQDFNLTHYRLSKNCILAASPVLLRHIAVSWFISVQESIIRDGLFCTKLCDNGFPLPSQIKRLEQCERALVNIELTGYLNDANYLLQAVTQCFGLLAPLLQANIYSKPVVQVLLRCHAALREVCSSTRSQRSPITNDSIHHMIACITFYVARVLRTWGHSEKCFNVIDVGKQLLNTGTNDKAEEAFTSVQSKKSRLKPVVTSNSTMSHELNALEERLTALTKEQRASDELSGSEDAVTVLSYIVAAKPLLAYKEISKFRRRSRFLEFFVHVLHKALQNKLIEPGIEWSQEILTWLRKRNEQFYVNYSIISDKIGGMVIRGDDSGGKYAATLVAYGKEGKNKTKSKKRKKTMLRRKSGPILDLDEAQEEAERKAIIHLEKYFPELYKNAQKRLKLRKVTSDELPWRAEFNHLIGLFHMDMFLERIRKRCQFMGNSFTKSSSVTTFLDHKAWSLNVSNVLVRQVFAVYSVTNVDGIVDDSNFEIGQALLRSARLAVNSVLGLDSHVNIEQLEEEAKDTPRTQRTNSPTSLTSTHTMDPELASVQNNAIKDVIKVVMLSYRRGLVLAHRGNHWSLLQNISRSLFHSVAVIYDECLNTEMPVCTLSDMRKLTLLPLTFAADFLLDMLVSIQNLSLPKDSWLVDSFVGNIKDEKGGANLKFESGIDDISTEDLSLIKSIIFRSMEILHFEERWEKLTDLCLRFCSLSHDRYAEAVYPILIHAQHKLSLRVQQNAGNTAPILIHDQDGNVTNLNNKNYILSQVRLKMQPPKSASTINVGGFIDPEAHDVYGGGRLALAQSCTPFDTANSLFIFYQTLDKSKYVSRALIHSRKLFSLYLSSKQSTIRRSPSATKDLKGSSVCFTDINLKNQQATPQDYKYCDFTMAEDIEMSAYSHLPTVIESYGRTIELLISHGQYDLVAQACHELGNLEWHRGNITGAGKLWKQALDKIFKTNNILSNWRRLANGEDMSALFINKLGVWGCLLATILLCKLGEFVFTDVKNKTECALFSGDLIKALFLTSLPHPTSDSEYALYDIIPQQIYNSAAKTSQFIPGASSFIPNIDLFSDTFRCEVKTLINSIHWASQTLVDMDYNLKALPCLTLYQYLATFINRDIHRSVICRCLKVDTLMKIQFFSAAAQEMFVLLYGTRIPHHSDVAFLPPESPMPSFKFDVSKTIDHINNLKVLEILASKRISQQLFEIYGPHMTCEISFYQAKLIMEMASFLYCIPQRPTIQDLLLISPDMPTEVNNPASNIPKLPQTPVKPIADDVRSTISALSTASGYLQIKKMFSKREVPLTPALLKGMLLHVAEAMIMALLSPLRQNESKLLSSEVWFSVQCNLLLSQLHIQRQHSTLAAADAVEALRILQDYDMIDKAQFVNIKRISSALKNRENFKSEAKHDDQLPSYLGNSLEMLYHIRINPRLWLKCRLEMCKALSTHIVGLGSSIHKSGNAVLQMYCAEGMVEAEACDDKEMQACFLLEGARIDGLSTEESKKMLDDAVTTLDELYDLSYSGTICLVHCSVLLTDIQLHIKEWSSSHALQQYNSAHASILLQGMRHGNVIKHSKLEASTFLTPYGNIYHKMLITLSHVKLRIGKTSYSNLSDSSSFEDWNSAKEIILQAKNLCENSAVKDPPLLAEIYLELAKVQRALYFLDLQTSSEVLFTLKNSTNLTHSSEPSISRSALLEKAMFGIAIHTIDKDNFDIQSIAESLYSAFTLSQNLKNRSQLPGNIEVTTATFSDAHRKQLPDFVLLDMESNYDSIPLAVTTDDITQDPVVLSIQMAAEEFSWIHILHYKVLLHRKILLGKIKEEKEVRPATNETGSSNDYYADQQHEQSNSTVKSSMFSSNFTLRIQALHEYLDSNLKPYANTCFLPSLNTSASVLVVQWYRIKNKFALLWCNTKSKKCDKVLVAANDLARHVIQIKSILQKVEIYFGQTMAVPTPKVRSRARNKSLTVSTLNPQLEEDIKRMLTNITLFLSPEHDLITQIPFEVTVTVIESILNLFTIGCCFNSDNPVFNWISQLLENI